MEQIKVDNKNLYDGMAVGVDLGKFGHLIVDVDKDKIIGRYESHALLCMAVNRIKRNVKVSEILVRKDGMIDESGDYLNY